MKFLSLLLVTASEVLLATGLMAQVGPAYHSGIGTTGLNAGASQVPLGAELCLAGLRCKSAPNDKC